MPYRECSHNTINAAQYWESRQVRLQISAHPGEPCGRHLSQLAFFELAYLGFNEGLSISQELNWSRFLHSSASTPVLL
jgi:hypothetical protein